MVTVTTISALAFIFACFSRNKRFKFGLEIAFIIVTFLSCIHYNYGNDYNAYYWNWSVISQHSFDVLLSPVRLNYHYGEKPETGWIILNKIFGFKNGFLCLVAFISIIQNGIYYWFIKKYVEYKDYWFAFFIYIFTSKFFLLSLSMMRQGLAMSLMLILFHFLFNGNQTYQSDHSLLNNRIHINISSLSNARNNTNALTKLKKFIIIISVIILSISIHTSAVVVVCIMLLIRLLIKSTRVYSKIIIAITFIVFFISSFTKLIFDSMVSLPIFSKFTRYYVGTLSSNTYGIGFIIIFISYIIMLYFLIFKNTSLSKEEKYLIILSYMNFLLKPVAFVGAALIDRLGYYFSAFDVVLIPLLYKKIKTQILRYCATGLYILITVYSYFEFYFDPVYYKRFSEFHTIFEAFN